MDPGISGSAPFEERGESDAGPFDVRPEGPCVRGEPPPAWLVRTIESRVVPGLLRAHARDGIAGPRPAAAVRDAASPVEADVERLVDLLVADDVEGCEALLGMLRDAGTDAATLDEALIGPAARRLGERWDDDRCDFAAVSQGLWRLQTWVHAWEADAPGVGGSGTGRILVAAMPGCTHTLGAIVVAAAFRRAGWTVRFEAGRDAAALRDAVRAESFDLLGLCVGRDREIAEARTLVAGLRQASRRTRLRVLVGGPAFGQRADAAASVGADAWAADADGALVAARAQLRRARAARPSGHGLQGATRRMLAGATAFARALVAGAPPRLDRVRQMGR
jgi:methanogenic corrinoid protein MtbC1